MKKIKQLTITERVVAPTPKFFRKLRNIGLVLVAAGGAIMASPVVLPAVIINLAGYISVAGGVLTAISQATVDEKELNRQLKK